MIFSPKCLRSLLLLLTIAAVSLAPAVAQHEHRHEYDDGPVHDPAARVLVELHPVPDSGMVRGRYNLSYRNRETQPIHEFCLRLDPAYSYQFDSVLYLAAPVDPADIEASDTLLRVRLLPPIEVREDGVLALRFNAVLRQTDDALSFDDQFDISGVTPLLCVRSGARWMTGTGLGEVSHYDLAVVLDSSYQLAHSGRLLNERMVYGLLPEPREGELLHDLRMLQREAPEMRGVLPLHPTPRREYVVRDDASTGPTLIVSTDLRLSRQQLPYTLVTYYEPVPVDHRTTQTIATSLPMLWDALWNVLQLPRDESLSVMVGTSSLRLRPGNNTVILPTDMLDHDYLPAAMAVGLCNRLLRPAILDDHEEAACINLGLVYYLAATVLYDVYGSHGYEMLRSYESALMRKRLLVHGSVLGCQTGLIDRVYRIAAGHYALSHLIGADSARSIWSSFLQTIRSSYPGEDDMIALTSDLHPGELRTRLRIPAAYEIKEVADMQHGDDRATRVVVRAIEQRRPWPVEVAFALSDNDTIVDTAFAVGSETPDTLDTLYCTSEQPVTSVVIDPHHHLPLVNRAANYWFRYPKRFHYRPPDDLFPAYRRLQ